MTKLTIAGLGLATVLGLVGCGGGGGWTSQRKADVREMLALAYKGQQLTCATQVVFNVYSPDDWTDTVAHRFRSNGERLPSRLAALEGTSTRKMARCDAIGREEAAAAPLDHDTSVLQTAEERYYARNETYATEARLAPGWIKAQSTKHDICLARAAGDDVDAGGAYKVINQTSPATDCPAGYSLTGD